MFVSIINDCCDANESGRQLTRSAILFPQSNISILGVGNYSELEAAGNLIDLLDASRGEEGVIMVNAAPRHGSGKKWPNGTPFGYTRFKKTLIVSTVDGLTFSLMKKLNILGDIYVTDIPRVLEFAIEKGLFNTEDRDRVINTQFRSYEYMPFLAKWVHDGLDIPTENYDANEIPSAPKAIWHIDSFGNSKTTVLPEEVNFEPGKTLETAVGTLQCYSRLKDVPNGQEALVIGSSGLNNKRFLEVVAQGKSAANRFGLKHGFVLFS